MYTLGQVAPQIIECPGQPTADARLVLSCAVEDEIEHLRLQTSHSGAHRAIDTRDARLLAYYVAGGSDCQVTEDARFANYFWVLAERCRARAGLPTAGENPEAYQTELEQLGGGEQPPVFELPGLHVTARNWTPYVLGAIGVVALLVRTKRGR